MDLKSLYEYAARLRDFKSVTPVSYGSLVGMVQRMLKFAALTIACGALMLQSAAAQTQLPAASRTIKLAVLGDSLTAGLGLPAAAAFPVRLERALKAKGHHVEVLNAGVSGDTASAGRDRLDWSIPDGTDAVIVELGANDALRGIDPKVTRDALEAIIKRLKERKMAVMIAGMLAPPNLGASFAERFNPIYPELAKQYDVPLYAFFLDGVAAQEKLNQGDGIHPTAAGVDVIVEKILPDVEAFLSNIK
jgi:acyl-CoA thioesterase-1